MSTGLQPSREQLRRRYRPPQVKLLFIGEAPPASGRFFYARDSGLYRALREAFQDLDPAISDDNFLLAFQSLGCYLIDTCPDPVDRLDRRSRLAARAAGESRLSRGIQRLDPRMIVVLLRSIRGNVERAARRAGWQGQILDLPYPGRWAHHRAIFRNRLAPELKRMLGG